MIFKKDNLYIGFCTALLLSISAQQASGKLSSTAKLGVETSYNDNIFFIDGDRPSWAELNGKEVTAESLINPETGELYAKEKELDDYVIKFSPEMEIVCETSRYQAEVDGRVDFIKYQDLSELDDIDHSFSGKFDYEFDEYTKMGVDASYSRDSRPDRDLQTSGLIVGTYIRDIQQYGLSAEHEITSLSKVTTSYSYKQENFVSSDLDDEIAAILLAEINSQETENPTPTDEESVTEFLTPAEELLENRQAENSKLHTAALSYLYDIGDVLPDAYVFSSATYMHLTTDQSNQNNVMALVGFGYQLSGTLSFSLDVGARYSHEKYDDVQLQLLAEAPYYNNLDIERSQDEWGPVGHIELKYRGYLTDASVKASYDVQPASGRGTFTERTGLQVNIMRQLGEDFQIRGFSSYFLNSRDGVAQLSPVADDEALAFHYDIPQLRERLEEETELLNAVDETTLNLGVELKYGINGYFDLVGQYSYAINKEDQIQSDARRNRVFLRLDCSYPIW